MLVVREILCGSRRFNDIRRGIPRISRTVLSERLSELSLAGVISKRDGVHGPEYELTEAGRELFEIIKAQAIWGQRWLPRQRSRRGSRPRSGAGRYAKAGEDRRPARGANGHAVRNRQAEAALPAAEIWRSIALHRTIRAFRRLSLCADHSPHWSPGGAATRASPAHSAWALSLFKAARQWCGRFRTGSNAMPLPMSRRQSQLRCRNVREPHERPHRPSRHSAICRMRDFASARCAACRAGCARSAMPPIIGSTSGIRNCRRAPTSSQRRKWRERQGMACVRPRISRRDGETCTEAHARSPGGAVASGGFFGRLLLRR